MCKDNTPTLRETSACTGDTHVDASIFSEASIPISIWSVVLDSGQPVCDESGCHPRSWKIVPCEKRFRLVSRRDAGDRSWCTMTTHRSVDDGVNVNGTLTEQRHQVLAYPIQASALARTEVPESWPSSTPWPPGTRTRHAPRFFSHQSANDSDAGFGRSL